MGKLHELLAVENDLKNTTVKIMHETIKTFSDKRTLFTGLVKEYTPVDAEDPETFAKESKPVDYTVKDKLRYTLGHFNKFLDAAYQKEMTNMKARGDIVVSDEGEETEIEKEVPATMLLSLEKHLNELRNVFLTAPTLELGVKWEKDAKAKDTYMATGKVQYRSRKQMEPVVLHPATKEHPAQVEKVTKDIRVGQWDLTLYSACITSAEKSDYLRRIDLLIGAVKQARARANTQEVEKSRIAQKLFDYIMK
jgi:hypothetical protein